MTNKRTKPGDKKLESQPTQDKARSFMDLVRADAAQGHSRVGISSFQEGETVWAVNQTRGPLHYYMKSAGGVRHEFTVPKTGPHPIPISGGDFDANVPQVPLEVLKADPDLRHYLNGKMPVSTRIKVPPLRLMREAEALEYYMGMAGSDDPADAAQAFREIAELEIKPAARKAAAKSVNFSSGMHVQDGVGNAPPVYMAQGSAEHMNQARQSAYLETRVVDSLEIEDDQLDFDLPDESSVQKRVIDLCKACSEEKITPTEFGRTLRNYAADGLRVSYDDARYAYEYGPKQCQKFCAQLAASIDPSKPLLYHEFGGTVGAGHTYGSPMTPPPSKE